MVKSVPQKKPQLNVQLKAEEMDKLLAICEAESIDRPSALVGVWIRENIKAHEGTQQLMDILREAKKSEVDVVSVIARAIRLSNRRKSAAMAS